MTQIFTLKQTANFQPLPVKQILQIVLVVFVCVISVYTQNISLEENTLTIDEVKGSEVFAFGKNVIIKKEAKGVLVFGGDIFIEGKVEGDTAVIGGSIHQLKGAYIGGDVIVIGGKYEAEDREPLRNPDKKTVMYAGYEEELREFSQNPARIFAPEITPSYFAQRLLSLLFWFIAAIIFTAVSPGAITRAIVRIQLSTLNTLLIGILSFTVLTFLLIMSFAVFPSYLSGVIGVMFFLIFVIAYVFGRISLQAAIGKYLQNRFFPAKKHSESIALLLGSFVITVVTSLPYLGFVAVALLFAASLGLVITSRSKHNWAKIS